MHFGNDCYKNRFVLPSNKSNFLTKRLLYRKKGVTLVDVCIDESIIDATFCQAVFWGYFGLTKISVIWEGGFSIFKKVLKALLYNTGAYSASYRTIWRV